MNLSGSHVIEAAPERIWAALNNPEVLARCAPGVKSLEPDGPDQYKAAIEVAVGPVKGIFQGKISISDKVEPQSMTLRIEAKAPVGIVVGIGKITLEPTTEPDRTATLVNWQGTPQLAGMLATVGARLVQGVAKSQADLFFSKLQSEVQGG